MEEIPALTTEIALPDDMIFVLGAGNISAIIPKIIEHLQRRK
jgi:UDP-N-acetylmuramate-alanine ligase